MWNSQSNHQTLGKRTLELHVSEDEPSSYLMLPSCPFQSLHMQLKVPTTCYCLYLTGMVLEVNTPPADIPQHIFVSLNYIFEVFFFVGHLNCALPLQALFFISWRICCPQATRPHRSHFLEKEALLRKKQPCLRWSSRVFAVDPGQTIHHLRCQVKGQAVTTPAPLKLCQSELLAPQVFNIHLTPNIVLLRLFCPGGFRGNALNVHLWLASYCGYSDRLCISVSYNAHPFMSALPKPLWLKARFSVKQNQQNGKNKIVLTLHQQGLCIELTRDLLRLAC